MSGVGQVSIIVSDLETHPSLPRLLQSIARQSTGLDRTEIIVAGGDGYDPTAPNIWTAITGLEDIRLLTVDPASPPAQVRNKAASQAEGGYLVFLRPDYRLDPKYLTTAFSVLEDNPETDILYSDYIRMAPKRNASIRPGMVQVPDFDDSLLMARNFIGPAAFMRREVFERTQGYRENTAYREWDFWVQAAMTGNTFFHVNYPLASCEYVKTSFKERASDGRHKAMIVINNQAFFHVHQVRWALSYLRGERWAEAFGFMTIPSPMDVARMQSDFHMKQMGGDLLAREAVRQFEASPHLVEAVR